MSEFMEKMTSARDALRDLRSREMLRVTSNAEELTSLHLKDPMETIDEGRLVATCATMLYKCFLHGCVKVRNREV